MAHIYQILLIEEDEKFAGLVRAQLNKLDINISVEVIRQKEELSQQLKHHPPDLIISEYSRHGFTAIEDLNQLRRSHPNLPLILTVPMDGSEKQASELMLQGVSDYVMKGNLVRLGPAVKRELLTSEKWRDTRQQLEKSRDRYQNLVQSVNGIVWEADAETFKFYYVSPRSKDILGYEPSEWYRKKDFWKKHIHPEDRKKAINYCHYKAQRGENHTFDYRMITAEDNVVWLRDYVTVILKDGKPDRLRGFMIDITQEKKAERQRDKAYEIAGIGHWELDVLNNELFWSPTVKDLHEVPRDYTPTLEQALDFYKEGKYKNAITKAVDRAIETGEPFDLELKIITAEGNERWVRAMGETEHADGKCIRIYGSTQNITQRKKTEESFREMFKTNQLILESTAEGIYGIDTNGRCTFINKAASNMLGYRSEECIGKNMHELIHYKHTDGEPYPESECPIYISKNKHDSCKVSNEVFWKADGNSIDVEYTSNPMIEDGEVKGAVVAFSDITERKQYEEQLQESLERYNYVARATRDAIYDWDIDKNHLQWREGFTTLFGHELEDEVFPIEKWETLVHPEDIDATRKDLNRTLQDPTKSHWNYEYRFQKSDGSYAHIIENGYIIRDEDGRATRMIGAIRDITEQRELERLLDQAQQMAQIGAWEVDMVNEEIYWSAVTKQIHEVSPDFEPDLESSINFYKEGKSREKIKKLLEEAIENGKTSDVEVRLITAKGKEQWVRVKAEPEMIDGECIRLYGSIQDIHERKSAQLNMQEAYKERQNIMDRITDAFFAVDQDWKVTYWNNKAEQLLHTPKDEIIGQNLWENFEEAKELDFYTQYHKAIENQVTVHFEEYYPPEAKWFEVSAYPSEGGLSVFFRDITKQKERETQLKESLKEKETLLQEIHHRVKNNLAVVSGMMQLQAFDEEDKSLQQKLFDSVNRIRTMGTIHELLYQSRSFSKLNFHETIRKLVSEIISTFGPDFVLDTQFDLGHIHLNINQAIPTSLIINEVVTNALKHAFGGNGKGVLSISLDEKNSTVSLRINDNGKGLPEEFQELQSGESLGVKLIDTLAKQLEAEYTYQSMDNGGTQFTLTFEKADVKGIGNAKLR